MHYLKFSFCVCIADNSLYVAVSEEELSLPLPGPHVQRRAGGEAAFPPEDSNWVRDLCFDAQLSQLLSPNKKITPFLHLYSTIQGR